MIEQMLSSGIAPLELNYFPIKTTSRRETVGLRSVLKINSIELGSLFPKQYSVVANRNIQATKLVTWVFRRLPLELAAMEKAGRLPDIISMYVPTKMLMRGGFESLLKSTGNAMSQYLNRLYIECPSGLLLENTQEAAKVIGTLKEKYGLNFILGEYGDSFCPTLRIQGLPIDMVILDETVSDADSLQSAPVRSVIRLINELKMTAVIENTGSDEAVGKALSAGCARYIDAKGKTLYEVIANG